MEHANGGLQALVTQVRVELLQVGRHHQAFVDDGLVRQAADVVLDVAGVGHGGATTGAEQLDRHFLVAEAFATDEHLLDLRQALQGQAAEDAGVDRDLAPADQLQASGQDFAIHVFASRFGANRVLVEEDHADRVLGGQFDRESFLGDGAQEKVRLLDQQTTTVAGLAVGIDATAVGHAGQGFDGGFKKMVARLALHMGDQAETAVILEFIRMVQTCFHRGTLTRVAFRQRQNCFVIQLLTIRAGLDASFCVGQREVIVHSPLVDHKS
ncbi:hypothetical protein D9M71_100430 [compost metagenome]